MTATTNLGIGSRTRKTTIEDINYLIPHKGLSNGNDVSVPHERTPLSAYTNVLAANGVPQEVLQGRGGV